jgi:hypothetical protein
MTGRPADHTYHPLVQGSSPPTLFVVLADPPPDRVQEFHDWYDTVHGPDAIENGSFDALYRYRAVGPGWRTAPYLALWEGRYASEGEAWDYIRPRAHQLNDAGRVGSVSSVRWALMVIGRASRVTPTTFEPRVVTTVQNDWRRPEAAPSAEQWWRDGRLDDAPNPGGNAWLYSSDPAGRGPGYHLALFETHDALDDVVARWRDRGAPGTSPVPPYRTMFGEELPVFDDGAEPEPAPVWVMHWEPVARLHPIVP